MKPNGKNGRKKKAKDGKEPVKTRDRDENGLFQEGNGVGGQGGRPKGSMDFMVVAREKAKETGESLRDILWDTFLAMVTHAKEGDVRAAHFVADRLCGAVDRSPLVALQVNNAIHVGQQARADLHKMLKDGGVQETVLDILEAKTMEEEED